MDIVATEVTAAPRVPRRRIEGVIPHLVLAVVLLLLIPGCCDVFRLGLFAKYLSLAFCAVGLVLAWGYGGILSLGQGIFFGLGSYMTAMYMKLEASSVDPAAAVFGNRDAPPIPDFMTYNGIDSLPWWWRPFEHLTFTACAVLIVPASLAFALAYGCFRKRVGSVYFSIVTLALASIMTIVIIGQQGYTAGANGITDIPLFMGLNVQTERAVYVLYYVTALMLVISVLFGAFVLRSRLGKILIAVRDREDRTRFSGYDPALFKGFIFAVAALFSSVGGALFTIQVGFASPSLIGIVPSIEMVICAAIGGRLSLVGAVYGSLIVGVGKTYLSEQFVGFWLYLIGALFILVPMLMPTGLAGAIDAIATRWRLR